MVSLHWNLSCLFCNSLRVAAGIFVDDKIRQLLRDLGTAINESISGSDDVSRHIQRIREEG